MLKTIVENRDPFGRISRPPCLALPNQAKTCTQQDEEGMFDGKMITSGELWILVSWSFDTGNHGSWSVSGLKAGACNQGLGTSLTPYCVLLDAFCSSEHLGDISMPRFWRAFDIDDGVVKEGFGEPP